jgi:hypothetical protein
MSGHPHAKLAQEYWKEAETDAEAWKNWEHALRGSEGKAWLPCLEHPCFAHKRRYRRKPRTIIINGHEVPEPLRVKPEIGSVYYVACVSSGSESWFCVKWFHDEIDNTRFDAGMCHATKEAAIAHAKALLSFTQKGGEA